MNRHPKYWNELILSISECPLCNKILWKDNVIEHLEGHKDRIGNFQTIAVQCDLQDLDPCPEFIYVCPYCNTVPPDIFRGNRTDTMIRHINNMHGRGTAIKFSTVGDKTSLDSLIDKVKKGQELNIVFCRECENCFDGLHILLGHYVSTHLRDVTKSRLFLQYNSSPDKIPNDIHKCIGELSLTETQESSHKLPVELPSSTPETFLEPTQSNDIGDKKSDIRNETNLTKSEAEKKSDAKGYEDSLSRYLNKYPEVPHPRSILKAIAGIEDEETGIREPQVKTGKDDIFSIPRKVYLSHVKTELTFTNVRDGHISLVKARPLFSAEAPSVELITESDERFNCHVDDYEGLLTCEDHSLAGWFESNGIMAGCYLYLYSTSTSSEIEIAFNPQSSILKECLIAEWDEKEQRVKLDYKNIEVSVECSEHLFRSSVNLGDIRVLRAMARLYGSIFDVLYLGLRDLNFGGHNSIHYRDLHNMVIDKRLHPRLGSVFVELSKNRFCFEKLGEGYWRFHPDERIERILPKLIYDSAGDDSVTDEEIGLEESDFQTNETNDQKEKIDTEIMVSNDSIKTLEVTQTRNSFFAHIIAVFKSVWENLIHFFSKLK